MGKKAKASGTEPKEGELGWDRMWALFPAPEGDIPYNFSWDHL